MRYNLTDKLNFDDAPEIEIKGKVLTVKSDAVTVLKVMSMAEDMGEVEAMAKSKDLLFSEKDQKVIEKLNLNMADYITLMQTALSLALGEDPDDVSSETESRTTT